jgi:hypothetical protein
LKKKTSEHKGIDRSKYNNTSLSLINTTSRPKKQKQTKQKNSKDILKVNNTMDKMDFTDIYRVFHLTAPDCISFFFFFAVGCSKDSLKREVYSCECPHQKI